MTRADCRNVHRATLATRLRTTPPRAKQPADAPDDLPDGRGPVGGCSSTPRRATPREQVRRRVHSGCARTGLHGVPAGARPTPPPVTPRGTRWSRTTTTVSPLTMHPVALPAGRPAYLWFQQWRLLESATMPDGNHRSTTTPARSRWPTRRAARRRARPRGCPGSTGRATGSSARFGNPAGGRVGFSRDSRGYLASRLKLTRYAGHAIVAAVHDEHRQRQPGRGLVPRRHPRLHLQPRARSRRARPRITGAATVGSPLTADPGRWSPSGAATEIRWYAGRCARSPARPARRTRSAAPTSGSGSR